MSTRSLICVKVRPETKQLYDANLEGVLKNYKPTPVSKGQYVFIYCHHDGYPNGVGADLLKVFPENNPDTYEKLCKFISGGDTSGIGITETGEFVSDYYSTDEDFERNRPQQKYTEPKVGYMDSEYVYIFENGKWYIKSSMLWQDPKNNFEYELVERPKSHFEL